MVKIANKKYTAAVAYWTVEEARDAFVAAHAWFKLKNHAANLSRRDANIVYMQADNPADMMRLKEFLLRQPGAQPEGCYCKV